MSAKSAIEERLKRIGLPPNCSLTNNESYTEKWDEHLRKFSLDIQNYYANNRQEKEEFDEKLEILEEIEDYLVGNVFIEPIEGINYEIKAVVPFGSSASGLGMAGGDLDMTICVYPSIDASHKEEIHTRSNDILAKIFEKIMSRKMMNNRKWTKMEHIVGARVPIITGYVDGIEIDISISMTTLVSAQYLSSKVIDAYEKYNHQFILLAAFVKKWQKSKETKQNKTFYGKVFPNSCSTVLMVVLFMKYYGLLPDVDKKHNDKLGLIRATWERVNGGEEGSFGVSNKEVADWKKSNKCEVSIGTLFLLFLDFYTEVANFRWKKLMIEDGTFKRKRKDESIHQIIIVDVNDKDNKAASVTKVSVFRKMLYVAMGIVEQVEPIAILEELMDVKLFSEGTMRRKRKKMREQGLLD